MSTQFSQPRNPLITFPDGTTVQTIGDLHLGRQFVNGVPLDSRGAMEQKVRDEFEKLLQSEADYVVQVGDVFDKFVVDNAVVEYAASLVLKTVRKKQNQKRQYVILRGNHDDSKDIEKVSSFDLFAQILNESGLQNLHVVARSMIDKNFVFFGWSPDMSAEDLAKDTAKYCSQPLKAAFGHWDVNLPDHASHFNLVPVQVLKQITDLVITGHDHKPGTLDRDGVTIVKTGSVMPLAHGEEIEDDALIYTITLSEFDPVIHEGKVVRFILDDEEEVPEGNFLQVKVIPKPKKTSLDVNEPEPDTDSFNLLEVLGAFLEEQGIDEALRADVVERFRQSNAE